MIRVLHTGLRLPEKRDEIDLTHLPVLVSEWITLDTNLVKRKLARAEAISFFSPRAVESVFEQGISLPDIPINVVGTKTQQMVFEKYGRTSTSYPTFLSFSKSDLGKRYVSFELKDSCRSIKDLRGIHEFFSCYETRSKKVSVSDLSVFDWIILTSPRGADSFFSQISLEGFSGQFACLGETTFSALHSIHGVKAAFVKEGSISVDDLLDRIQD